MSLAENKPQRSAATPHQGEWVDGWNDGYDVVLVPLLTRRNHSNPFSASSQYTALYMSLNPGGPAHLDGRDDALDRPDKLDAPRCRPGEPWAAKNLQGRDDRPLSTPVKVTHATATSTVRAWRPRKIHHPIDTSRTLPGLPAQATRCGLTTDWSHIRLNDPQHNPQLREDNARRSR